MLGRLVSDSYKVTDKNSSKSESKKDDTVMEFNELEHEWHPTENLPVLFDNSLQDYLKYWWVCSNDHIWSATLKSRKQGRRCRRCITKKKTNVNAYNNTRMLVKTHPAIAAEWHLAKNGELRPDQVDASSYIKIWWICGENHLWKASIVSRAKGKGCPVCFGRYLIITLLTTAAPKLIPEYHPTRNHKLIASQVYEKASTKVWWVCTNGHEWEASLNSRISKGEGCLECGFSVGLALTHPQLVTEWHPTENGELKASQVNSYSSTKIWWICPKNHIWKASVIVRVKGKNCTVCSNYKMVENALPESHSPLRNELHPIQNSRLSQRDIQLYSVRWICPKNHEWEATIVSRIKGKECSICSGDVILLGITDLVSRKPKLITEWNLNKNGRKIEEISINSKTNYWWICLKGHEWRTSPTSLLPNQSDSGCPICSNQNLLNAEWHPTRNGKLTVLTITPQLKTRIWWICSEGHEWNCPLSKRIKEGNIIAGCPICSNLPLLIADWNSNKNFPLDIKEIVFNSRNKYWWVCLEGHEWESSPYDLTRRGSFSGCPICSNKKRVVIGENDLNSTHPSVAIEWHPTKNGSLTPEQITAGANNKYWWQGKCGHEWEAFLSNKIADKGSCPECRVPSYTSKPEQEIYDFICKLDDSINVKQSTKIARKELDIYIPKKKFAVEFNGVYWHSEKYRNNDYHYKKWATCRKLGITLLQIWEDDWNKHPDKIKRAIAYSLGYDEYYLADSEEIIAEVNESIAKDFLDKNHIEGYVSSTHYLSLFSRHNKKIPIALLALDMDENKTLQITRYGKRVNIVDGFNRLLIHAIETYNPDFLTAVSNNCGTDGELYERNGFVKEKPIPPDYTYLEGNKRVCKTEYSMDRFKSDSKLEWCDGFTEEELAYLNGVLRVWDAGKTLYRY